MNVSEIEKLEKKDFDAVKQLLEEVRDNERKNKIKRACSNWITSYLWFKRIEKTFGLPKDEPNKEMYGALLADIKSSGLLLKQLIIRDKIELAEHIDVENKDFIACVEHIKMDDFALYYEPTEFDKEIFTEAFEK